MFQLSNLPSLRPAQVGTTSHESNSHHASLFRGTWHSLRRNQRKQVPRPIYWAVPTTHLRSGSWVAPGIQVFRFGVSVGPMAVPGGKSFGPISLKRIEDGLSAMRQSGSDPGQFVLCDKQSFANLNPSVISCRSIKPPRCSPRRVVIVICAVLRVRSRRVARMTHLNFAPCIR